MIYRDSDYHDIGPWCIQFHFEVGFDVTVDAEERLISWLRVVSGLFGPHTAYSHSFYEWMHWPFYDHPPMSDQSYHKSPKIDLQFYDAIILADFPESLNSERVWGRL